MQLNVLVLGMKHASKQLQRRMELVLRDMPNAHPCIDDIIVRSNGETAVALIENQKKEIRKVLKPLEENQLVARPAKSGLSQKGSGVHWTCYPRVDAQTLTRQTFAFAEV